MTCIFRPTGSPAAERLREFVRKHAPGQCKMLSKGDGCECPLCDIDTLVAGRIRKIIEETPPGPLSYDYYDEKSPMDGM